MNKETPLRDPTRQCGVCGTLCLASHGLDLPSGNRDPRTGRTPMDNFVCNQCRAALARPEQRAAA